MSLPLRIMIFAGCLAFFFTNIQAQDLYTDLVGYYSFCGCNANDHSGNENHGTLVGTPECIEGIIGEGFFFNRLDQQGDCGQRGGEYVQIPTLGPIWENGFTVCAWVRFESNASFERIIDFGNSDGDSGGLPIWFGREGNTNNLTLESWIDSDPNTNRTTGRLVAENAITNGQIEFYCATINRGVMRIFVNGDIVAEKAGHPILNVERTNNFIGRSNWCDSDPDFTGFMDEVRIYNKALSPEQIQQVYDAPFFFTDPEINICAGESVQLETQGGIQYEWSPADFLDNPMSPNPISRPTSNIEYQVNVVLPDGCAVTDKLKINILPEERDTIDVQICEGDAYEGYTISGTYFDTLRADNGCPLFRVINLESLPSLEISEMITICQGETYDGYSVSGVYSDTLTSIGGCDSIRTVNLLVQSPIFSTIEVNNAACGSNNGIISFTTMHTLGQELILLNDSLTTSSNQFEGLASGIYVLAIEDISGCRTEVIVEVGEIPCLIYVPTIFSPNGDGINDQFVFFPQTQLNPIIISYQIYSRWGELLYELKNIPYNQVDNRWWDGVYKGELLTQSLYIYHIELEYENGHRERVNGAITLIR